MSPAVEAAEKKLTDLVKGLLRATAEIPEQTRDRVVRLFKGVLTAGKEWLDLQKAERVQ